MLKPDSSQALPRLKNHVTIYMFTLTLLHIAVKPIGI